MVAWALRAPRTPASPCMTWERIAVAVVAATPVPTAGVADTDEPEFDSAADDATVPPAGGSAAPSLLDALVPAGFPPPTTTAETCAAVFGNI